MSLCTIDSMVDDFRRFFYENTYADFQIGDDSPAALVFYEDPDTAYITMGSSAGYVLSGAGKKILEAKEEEPRHMVFHIYDYETGTIISQVESQAFAENESVFLYTSPSCMGDTCACLILEDGFVDESGEETTTITPYLWIYTQDSISIPFDVTVLKKEDLSQDNEQRISHIKDAWQMTIVTEINEELQSNTFFNKKVEMNLNPLLENLMLRELENIFALFPEGIFYEIQADYFDGFDVYLCSKVLDDETVAFQGNANGRIYMVFAPWGFYRSTIAHEIMHSMEMHLKEEYQNDWVSLIPEDYIYCDSNLLEDSELDDYRMNYINYFFSYYGQTNELEDRAETFEYMFESGSSDMAPDWTENENLMAKARYLDHAIRDSFSSVANTKEAYWEKYVSP